MAVLKVCPIFVVYVELRIQLPSDEFSVGYFKQYLYNIACGAIPLLDILNDIREMLPDENRKIFVKYCRIFIVYVDILIHFSSFDFSGDYFKQYL